MNASIDFPSDNKTCRGKCILEMQKILEPSVIMEFFEVVRDFHNDDKTARKLKNIILSETSEAVKLLNERASEMILMVDEMFLNRRQRQSSFYRLCHDLARKASPEGDHLPDKSKCVCFSAENLRKFNVDPGANTNLDFSSNLMSVKEAIKQYFGELRCTNCERFMQLCRSGSMMSSVSDCNCSSPSVASQHKVHEAILELSKSQENKVCQDPWYLTQLKRDADYFMNRYRTSSISSSDESVNSFEVISCSNQVNFQETDAMDNESLSSDLSIQEESDKLSDPLQNSSVCPASDIQNFSKNLNNKLMHSFSTNLTDANKGNVDTQCRANEAAESLKITRKRLNPADVLRQSFSPYFDKCNNAQILYHSTKRNDLPKVEARPAECLRHKLLKLRIDSRLTEFGTVKKPVNLTRYEKPSVSLKSSLDSYFKKEALKNWLRN